WFPRSIHPCPAVHANAAHRTDSDDRLRAADIARRRRPRRLAVRTGRARPRPSSRAPRANAPTAASWLDACDRRASCVRAAQYGGAGAQSAVISDHAESHRDAEARAGHGPRQIAAGELAHGLDESEKAGGAACLAHRQLAAAGVEGERAIHCECMAADEVRPLALAAKAEVLELNDRHHGIV